MQLRRGLRRNRGGEDMTSGNIAVHLIRFALPLLAGNIFQQLYNTVDTWVVGNYVSNEAFSAVGSVGPIVNTLIGFFLGLSAGAGVVISQFYGAKNDDGVSRAVHTAVLMTLFLSIIFTGIGIIMIPLMLNFMNTPPEVIPEATTYLTIYFGGMIGLMVYNMNSSIMRAIGDSTRPFIFLVISAVINTVLDLVFVLCFGMGVEGVAYATIIAQIISAILTTVTLMRSNTCIKIKMSMLKIDFKMLGKIVKVGIPAALQMAITSFSNIFVLSYINNFGTDCMSGWAAYGKIDQLLLLPMQSLALASTTFVGQNLGINDVPRAKKGVRITLLLSIASTVILMIPVMIWASSITAFFNDKPEVVEYGAMMLRLVSPFYVLCCINQIYAGALRGAGNSNVPMIIMLGSFVAFRQLYLFVISHLIPNNIIPVALGYPAGWIVASIATIIYYHNAHLSSTRLVDE